MVISDLEIKVGPQTPVSSGVALSSLRAGKDSSLIVQAAHHANAEAGIRGNIFSACNTSAVTFGTALTATGVTVHLCNPIGSPVDLVILQTNLSLITCSTAGTVVYALSGPSGTAVTAGTPLAPLNAYGVAGYGLAKQATTLPATPVSLRPLASGTTAAGLGVYADYPDGALVVTPGCQISIQGITIVGTGICGMTWEEVPR